MTTAAAVVSYSPTTLADQRLRRFSPGAVEVEVQTAQELDDVLNRAVMLVMKTAIKLHTGILVTRMDAGRYVVQACPDVPTGLIRQRYV